MSENLSKKDANLVGVVAVLLIVAIGAYIFTRQQPKVDAPTTAPSPKGEEDYQKVVNNDFGRLTINAKGGSITSVAIAASSDAEKEKLRQMLSELEVARLAALRTCSLTLTFGGFSDRGDLYNCTGERIGALSKDAVGYLKDGMVARLQERGAK